MHCAPSAAAKLLLATVEPAGDASVWRDADPGTREAALRLCTLARLDALLAARLAAHAPEALRERAARETTLARLAWVEGARVLAALEAHGCRPIALKGADVSARAWPIAWAALPDHSTLRAAADLDALVPDDAPAAEAMRSLGYAPDADEAAHHSRWRRSDGFAFSVEIHRDLFDRPHGLALDLPAQHTRAVLVRTPLGDGEERRVLSPEDAFVHVAAHAAWSDALSDPISALRAPLDLVALATAVPLDAGLIVHRAQSAGLALAVSVAVEWTLSLVPHRALAQIPFPAPRGWRALAARRRTLRLASAATHGRSTRVPFTATRALLAPTAASAAAMLLAGARRRTR